MLFYKRLYIITKQYSKNISGKCYQRFASTEPTKWKPTVGLEIHAQIATNSKLFSAASTQFSRPTNSCVSLFDCAIPGTMPVLNKKCVEAGVLTALALDCKLNEMSVFERKHYFYADLPAGYQITQQKYPLANNGVIKFDVYNVGSHKSLYTKTCKIKQVQLEQDSGKSLHDESVNKSLIDLNRAGIPLMELVFEPDLADGEEAASLVKELILILQLLGTCSCKMDEGALRVDANVSISRVGEPLGVRTELKNIGSVRAVANAVRHEIKRQTSILEAGGQIFNETRAWDAQRNKTIPMRVKEETQDYRFMPETNLPPLRIHVNENLINENNLIEVASLRKQLPDLPNKIRQKLREDGLSPTMITVLLGNLKLFKLFNDIVTNGKDYNPQSVAKVLANEVLTFLNQNKLEASFCFDKQHFIEEVLDLLQSETINLLTAKKVLNKLVEESNKMPKQIVEENNWYLIKDERKLEEVCLMVMKDNAAIVEKYKAGKKQVLEVLMHKVIGAMNDCANMPQVSTILERLLK